MVVVVVVVVIVVVVMVVVVVVIVFVVVVVAIGPPSMMGEIKAGCERQFLIRVSPLRGLIQMTRRQKRK